MSIQFCGKLGAAATLITLVLGGFLAGPALAQDDHDSGIDRKLKRQVDVFEQITSQMLLDSPNFLVSGRHSARGLYIEEFGVVVSFNASLVSKDNDWEWPWSGYKIERDGDKIIVITPGDDDDDDESAEIYEDYKNWQSKHADRQAKLYSRGKQEIKDLFLDYADGMRRLRDDQWVMVAAFLRDSEYFEDRELSRLIVKAQMRDLRAYADGTLDEDGMLERLRIQEY